MLLDENLNIRNQALNQIIKIRALKEDITFKTKLKLKSIMKINFDAESWDYLVSVDDIQVEPPTTLCITSENLREAIKSNLKLCVIDMPNNSQSVERAVKLTSEASKQAYGYKKRHKIILTKIQSQRENKRNVKKCDYFIK